MTTANQLIIRAAKTAKILAAGEIMEDEDAQDILQSLNDMLHAWELDGIDLGHTDLELTDTVQLPDSHIRAIRYNLAADISSEDGAELNAIDAERATNGFRMLQAYYAKPGELQIPTRLASIGYPGRYRIINDG